MFQEKRAFLAAAGRGWPEQSHGWGGFKENHTEHTEHTQVPIRACRVYCILTAAPLNRTGKENLKKLSFQKQKERLKLRSTNNI